MTGGLDLASGWAKWGLEQSWNGQPTKMQSVYLLRACFVHLLVPRKRNILSYYLFSMSAAMDWLLKARRRHLTFWYLHIFSILLFPTSNLTSNVNDEIWVVLRSGIRVYRCILDVSSLQFAWNEKLYLFFFFIFSILFLFFFFLSLASSLKFDVINLDLPVASSVALHKYVKRRGYSNHVSSTCVFYFFSILFDINQRRWPRQMYKYSTSAELEIDLYSISWRQRKHMTCLGSHDLVKTIQNTYQNENGREQRINCIWAMVHTYNHFTFFLAWEEQGRWRLPFLSWKAESWHWIALYWSFCLSLSNKNDTVQNLYKVLTRAYVHLHLNCQGPRSLEPLNDTKLALGGSEVLWLVSIDFDLHIW